MDSPVPVNGTQIIIRVEFLVFGEGSGPIDFLAPNIGGSDASALLDENGDPIEVKWFSGVITGQQE